MEEPPEAETRSFAVGSDRVTLAGEVVLIEAHREIRDWSVREFHRHAIYFLERKYYLRARQAGGPPFAWRYELAPWPDNLHEQSRQSFTYDAAFVAMRDREVQVDRKRDLIWYVLLPLYPLLGLCWSKFKTRVLWPIGFAPQSITAASTMLVFCIAMADGILFGYFGSGVMSQFIRSRGAAYAADVALWGVLLLDCAVRYDQVIRHDDVPSGFLEWAFNYVTRKISGSDR